MKLTDDMIRAAFAVLFDKHRWERDAEAEEEAREALQAALDAWEPERRHSPGVAARQRWARIAARNATNGREGERP
jgi:hypothetical protein